VRAALGLLFLASCTTEDTVERAEPLAPLPAPAPVATDRFRDAETCAQCHLAGEGTPVLHDAAGRNISPSLLWRSSLMGLAARDPYYLAVFSEEIAADPDNADAIAGVCTRCHAPAGHEEAGGALTFDDLVSGTSPAAVLGRGGVTCTLCHQIAAQGLGDETSFTGGFDVGYQRRIFGRYPDPNINPMQLIVNYTPEGGSHIAQSELCGSCHTVVVRTAGGPVVEQATFLEWRSSSFVAQGKACQACHVPVVDEAGVAIAAPITTFSSSSSRVRTPVGRHTFVGGNSYVLSLIADAIEWSGAGVSRDEVLASAARDEAHLREAAELAVVDTRREGSVAVITIKVTNLTGHKLPTGYPSRRMWLHVTASAGGSIVFESGGDDRFATQPHRDEVSAADEVQAWESELVDDRGQPTHRALDARRYGKDNRILPAGFAPASPSDRTRTAPVGVDGDATFVAGSDTVTYRLIGVPAGATIAVELLYQAIRPSTIDAIDRGNTPAGTRFVDLARARPVTPVVMATASATIP